MKGFIRLLCLTLLMMTFGLAGCGEEAPIEGAISIYYLNHNETKMEAGSLVLTTDTAQEQIAEIILALGTPPKDSNYKAPIGYGFGVSDYTLKNGRLTINLSSEYYNLPSDTEILIRAAIVESLTQVEEVSYITILVEGERLVDSLGETVGTLTKDTFIHNDGNDINTYEQVRVKLYFANEKGDALIATYREKHYSTNTPLERFIVEELIAGPSGQVEGIYQAINPETKIVNVMTKDGICYVNLDSSFLTAYNDVSLEMAAYSIANSITELNNISSVQILVNGEIPELFKITNFEKNMDIVTNIN